MRFYIPFGLVALVAACTPASAEGPAPAFPGAGGESASRDADSKSAESRLVKDDDEVAPNDPETRAKAKFVRVIENDHLDCPTELVGLVDIHEPVQNQEQAIDVLKRKAVKLHADAVIGVEFHHGEPGEEPTHLSGMAVRCKDLIQGRQYDVLGKIDINGDMGDEDTAYAKLRERARGMRADLIIDIGYEHGEGEGKPSKVWGTAIKFK